MNEKEMIEEMASLIKLPLENWLEDTGAIPPATTYYSELMSCINDSAEVLYNEGYRKIPEGSVVIPKKITEETSIEDIIKIAKYNYTIREKARKKTAKEILRDLYHAEYELTIEMTESSKQDVETVMKALALCQNNKIKELAKKYGVKVEE